MSPIADASVRTHGRAASIFIFVTVLLDMLALGVIVPVLPALVLQFRSGDTASGAIIYGLFASDRCPIDSAAARSSCCRISGSASTIC